MLKKFIFLVLILSKFITIGAQYSEDNFKSLFFNRITNLNEFEGIFQIKSAIIKSPNCNERIKEVVINEKIAIYKDGSNLNVYSISKQKEIGIISLKYESAIEGKLTSTGFSGYLDCEIRKFFWYSSIPVKSNISSLGLSAEVKMAIQNSKAQCPCPQSLLEQCAQYCCNIELVYGLEKTFPNKNEPPPLGVSYGTGVIISPDGYVITNRHILEKEEYYWIENKGWEINKNPKSKIIGPLEQILGDKLYHVRSNLDQYSSLRTNITTEINGETHNLQPVLFHTEWKSGPNGPYQLPFFKDEDLIVLSIENHPTNLPYAVFDTLTQEIGNEVYTLGYPLSNIIGNQMVYSNGYFSFNQNEYNIYNLGINLGNSGGGIFDKETGNLVGIATAKLSSNSTVNSIEGIAFSTRLNNFTRITKTKGVYFRTMRVDNLNSPIPFWNYSDPDGWTTSLIRVYVRDNNFKPNIKIENNKKATIQITAK